MSIHDKYPNHWGDVREYFTNEAIRRFGLMGEDLPREKAEALADWLIDARHAGFLVSLDNIISLYQTVEIEAGGRFKANALALPKPIPGPLKEKDLSRAGRRMKPWKRGKAVVRYSHP